MNVSGIFEKSVFVYLVSEEDRHLEYKLVIQAITLTE